MRFFSRRNASLVLSLAAVGVLAACGDDVTVPVAPAAPVTVSITPQAISLTPGSTAQLSVQITGGDPTPTLASCASGSAAVATAAVSGAGCRVTAVAAGSTTITATTSAGQAASAAVNVSAAPAAIGTLSVSPAQASLGIGGTVQLTPVFDKGADAVTTTVSYTSSATSIATVSTSGLVTGVAQGSATVTVNVTGTGAGFSTVTRSAAVAITVAPPAQVIINSLTDNGATIDINNVQGQFEANLSLQPNGQIVTSVEAWVCLAGETVAQCAARSGSPAARQSYGATGGQAGAVQLYINSAEFAAPNFETGDDASTAFKNGLKTIVATVTTAGGTSPTASNSLSAVNFNNIDGWTIQWTQPENKAVSSTGVTWYGGPTTPDPLVPGAKSGLGSFTVVPVMYTPGRSITRTTLALSSACGSAIVDSLRPFRGTYGQQTRSTANVAFSCSNNATTADGHVPQVTASVDNNNAAGPVANGGTPAPATSIFQDVADGSKYLRSLTYRPTTIYIPADYQAPTISSLNVRGGGATSVDSGWVNASYTFDTYDVSGNPLRYSISDANVGLFAQSSRNTVFDVCATPASPSATAPTTCATPAFTGGRTATVSSMGITESSNLTNQAYFVIARETDRLGNRATSEPYSWSNSSTGASGTATPGGQTFGVDLTAPELVSIPNSTSGITGYLRTDRDSIVSTIDGSAHTAVFAVRFTDTRSGFFNCTTGVCLAATSGEVHGGTFQIVRHTAPTTPSAANAAVAANLNSTASSALGKRSMNATVLGSDPSIRQFTVPIYGESTRCPIASSVCSPASSSYAATTDAYYRFSGTLMDRAGNTTTLPTRSAAVDNSDPTISSVGFGPAVILTGGTSVNFSITAGDALEVIAGDLGLRYGNGGPAGAFDGTIRFNRVPSFTSSAALGLWHNPFQSLSDGLLATPIGAGTALGATGLTVPAPFIQQLTTVDGSDAPRTATYITSTIGNAAKPDQVSARVIDIRGTSSRAFAGGGMSAPAIATISPTQVPSATKRWGTESGGLGISTWSLFDQTAAGGIEFRVQTSTSTTNIPFARVHVVRDNGAEWDYLGDATLVGTFDQGGNRFYRYSFEFDGVDQGQYELAALEAGDVIRGIGVDASGNALSTQSFTLSGDPAVTSVVLTPASVTLAAGSSQLFTATVIQPAGANAATLNWTLTNNSGTCTVTYPTANTALVVGVTDGGATDCTIAVSATATTGGGFVGNTVSDNSTVDVVVAASGNAITSVTGINSTYTIPRNTTLTLSPVVTIAAGSGASYALTVDLIDGFPQCEVNVVGTSVTVETNNPGAKKTCILTITATASGAGAGFVNNSVTTSTITVNFD